MLPIFLKTLPFFALIGVGYWAGRTRFFSAEATAYLTKFVFYFALSAMLFRFTADLSFAEVWDTRLAAAYLWGTAFVYGIATAVGFLRGMDVPTTAFEAQTAAIGNTGFLDRHDHRDHRGFHRALGHRLDSEQIHGNAVFPGSFSGCAGRRAGLCRRGADRVGIAIV